ncbi:MAG: hypothetical protein PHI34_07215 [Acidobacteriota bacterium]|nr:hypothetical protein [Acidobacteriota bacterium]
MEAAHKIDEGEPSLSVRADELPLDARPGFRTLTLRDDRLDFAGFGDEASSCRRRRARLRLIDLGRFSVSELEWLGEAGTDIYTSDRVKRAVSDLILIRRAAGRGCAWAVFFQHGPIDEPGLEALRELGRSGLDIQTSNAAMPRDFADLSTLAWDCGSGAAVFVYQHHGPLDPGLETLAGRGAWIHLTNGSLASADDVAFAGVCAKAARAHGANVILHVETRIDPDRLAELAAAGTFVLFKTPLSDYRSPLRPFEDAAARRRLPPRSYYLFPDYVL